VSSEPVSESLPGALKPVRRADLPRVLEIESACFQQPWPQSAFELAVRTPRIHFLGVWPPGDERLAGYVVAVRDAEGVLIANLAVAPESRGAGLGTTLLRGAIGWARRIGAPRCHLEVRAGNPGAIGLYRREGFRPVGLIADYYRHPREDALSMVLALREWRR
jgi:ribosomal-protein-alanine N-acetyltransferase